MTGTPRRYTEAERTRAVDLIVHHGRSAASVARELDVGATSVRRWLAAYYARDWADRVAVHFGWLSQYGFAETETDASWVWYRNVVYRRDSAAVVVIEDREFGIVEVRLVRAAKVRLAQRYLRVDGEVTGVAYASKLVWLRAADPDAVLSRIDGLRLDPAEVDTQLDFWAEVLRTYGADFLAGEFDMFALPDPVIRHRKRR